MTPIRLCSEPHCRRPATARGLCDLHCRAVERERSRERKGGLKRGGDGYDEAVKARDRDPDFRYPRRRPQQR